MKKQVADPKKIKASSRNRDSFIACSGFCVICPTMKKRSLKNSSLINHDGSMKPLLHHALTGRGRVLKPAQYPS
jgi:hypothetical protein